MEIKDKVAVITGGARGIGFAIAKRFANKGAKVVIGDVAGYEEAAADLRAQGFEALGVKCDVTREEDAQNLAAIAVKTFGSLDIAVLNAGILRDGLLLKVERATGKVVHKIPPFQWPSVIDVNPTGIFLAAREATANLERKSVG